jgi:mannosyltransferase OCH1-like enzyme
MDQAQTTMNGSRVRIPRVLHYMFLTPPGIPPPTNVSNAYHFWLSSCARVNPGWQVLLWDRDDCTRLATAHFPDYARWFSRNLSKLGVIRQADFCRLMVLSRFGGVYVDFDVLCLRPLDQLLPLPLFAADEPAEHKLMWGRRVSNIFPCNAIMGSQPHHPFWRLVMRAFRDRCVSWERRHQGHPAGSTAPIMTGPHMLATVWRKYQASRKARQLERELPPQAVLLPTSSFYPVAASVERGRAFDAPRTYPNGTLAAHQWGSFYTSGHVHELGRRPLPAFVEKPAWGG